MPGDLAWKQRVILEDRKLLAQVVEARRRLAEESRCDGGSNVDGSHHAACSSSSVPRLEQRSNKQRLAAPVGTTIRGNHGASSASSNTGSVAPSCRSSTTTQISHKGASTVQGSAAISQLTAFSSRLEKLEQRLADEHKERMRVTDELTQIRQLLLQQQNNNSMLAGRKSR